MPANLTRYISNSNVDWDHDLVNIRLLEDLAADRLSVVMTGAGLSASAMPRSPTWKTLIDQVAKNLDIEIEGRDTRIDAMTVSWFASRRQPSAEATRFQKEIAKCIDSTYDFKARDQSLQAAFIDFLDCVSCDVVIDLNYDKLVEEMLDAAKISYYRIIGAQLDIRAPLPEEGLLLWKVHGSVDYPATIVLSPTEYQRIYHVNDLGIELTRLGSKAHSIWAIGVGLVDDDVWNYLTSMASKTEIVAFWLTEEEKIPESDNSELTPWREILGEGVTTAKVLNASFKTHPRALEQALKNFVAQQRRGGRPPGSRRNDNLRATLRRFDERWATALQVGTSSAFSSVVDEFSHDYKDLVLFMLTKGDSQGSRWLPFLKADVALSNRKMLIDEFVAILRNAEAFKHEFASGQPNEGLLVRNCVQSVVRYVFDLLETFDLPYNLTVKPPISNELPPRDILVGANPFDPDVQADSQFFNMNHVFSPKNALKVGSAIVGNLAGAHSGTKVELLTEDEWEFAVRKLYLNGQPTLTINRTSLDLGWVTPIFPWGFGRNGLHKYRRSASGTVTRAWHLVSTPAGSSQQICKGGSLRDRGDRAFMLGRRGHIRIGESDDFVQPAVRIH